MSLATASARIYCRISRPPLSGAMEDCFKVRVQRLQMLCRRRCWMSAWQRMFGSLWNASATRRSRRPGMMAKRQTTTGGRTWPPWNRRPGALVASVADGALAMYGRSVEYRSPDGQRRSEPTAAGSLVLPRYQTTVSCSSPGARKRTPGPMFYSHLQTLTGQPAVAGEAGSSRFDRPQRHASLNCSIVSYRIVSYRTVADRLLLLKWH